MTGDLRKVAGMGQRVLDGVRRFNNMSVWSRVGRAADKRIADGTAGAGWRGAKMFADTMGGLPGTALAAYGFGGLAADAMGYDLPGSQLAMNIATPAWGLATMLPNAIRGARLSSGENQQRLKDDVTTGAKLGTDDFLTAINSDPSVLSRPNGFQEFMKRYTGNFAGQGYMDGGPAKRPSAWSLLSSGLSDSQRAVDTMTDYQIRKALLQKSAGWRSALGAAGTLGMGALGAAGIAGTAADTASAVFGDKPYDEQSAQSKGYAAAQAAIQKRLNDASYWERFALKLDPTLAVQGIEQKFPGTLKHWESNTGMKYTPGWLSSIHEAWRTGGKPVFYQHDADGNRHYMT